MDIRNEEYGLLIVDDEGMVRSAVTNIIDWKSLGFSSIYEAEDGEDALEICRHNKVDLVLTDIIMPFMDGMELSKILKEEFPEIIIVVLTGHEEFEYAKQSIKYGVKNYILKPIGADSLFKEMKSICGDLHMMSQQKQYLMKMKSQLHKSLPLLRERFLYSLVCTDYHRAKENDKQIKSLELPLQPGWLCAAMIECDVSMLDGEDMELYLFAMKNICIDMAGSEHCVFEDNQRVIIIFNFKQERKGQRQAAIHMIQKITEVIGDILEIQWAGALGGETDTVNGLHQSYCEANLAMEYRYLLGYNQIYDFCELDYREHVFSYPTQEIKQFIYSMKFLGVEQMVQAMCEIERICIQNREISILNIKMIFFEILNSIIKELSFFENPMESLCEEGVSLYHTMNHLSTMQQFSKRILEYGEKVYLELHEVRANRSNELILSVREYMEQKYHDPELSLSVVAAHIGMNTNYLSSLFKKETGINFVEYLTKIRMEHAMVLMQTTELKNYEIADHTGFSNPHYFSISFKKYIGLSPSEFRSRQG